MEIGVLSCSFTVTQLRQTKVPVAYFRAWVFDMQSIEEGGNAHCDMFVLTWTFSMLGLYNLRYLRPNVTLCCDLVKVFFQGCSQWKWGIWRQTVVEWRNTNLMIDRRPTTGSNALKCKTFCTKCYNRNCLKRLPIGYKNVSQDRQSLVTRSITVIYRTFCWEYLVFRDRWSLMAVVSQDSFHCTVLQDRCSSPSLKGHA